MAATLQPLSGDIISLKFVDDIMNVHPVLHLVFRSSRRIDGLKDYNIVLNDGPPTSNPGTVQWSVMSYRKIFEPDGTGVVYSVYAYPLGVQRRVVVNGVRDTASYGSAQGYSVPLSTGPFDYLSKFTVNLKMAPPSKNWTVAFALMQHKLQTFRDLTNNADPDNWSDLILQLPVHYLSGRVLMSTTLSKLFSNVADATGKKELQGIDKQWVWEDALDSYILATGERSRSFKMLGVVMFSKVHEFHSNVVYPFLQGFKFDFPDPDFANKRWIMFKRIWDKKKLPMPWTYYFGTMDGQ